MCVCVCVCVCMYMDGVNRIPDISTIASVLECRYSQVPDISTIASVLECAGARLLDRAGRCIYDCLSIRVSVLAGARLLDRAGRCSSAASAGTRPAREETRGTAQGAARVRTEAGRRSEETTEGYHKLSVERFISKRRAV